MSHDLWHPIRSGWETHRLRKSSEMVQKYLQKLQNSHSKTSQLILKNFTPSEYLLSPDLNKEEVQTLYKLRNRMLDVKCNRKSFYTQNLWCRTCFLFPESQQHLMQCITLVDRLKDSINFQTFDYNSIWYMESQRIKLE